MHDDMGMTQLGSLRTTILCVPREGYLPKARILVSDERYQLST